jgi:hypothetical protein
LRPLGIAYVDIFVAPGIAAAVTDFYRKIFRAITRVEAVDGATMAIISAGPFQTIRFIERELDNHDTHSFHLPYHVTHYNEARDRIAASGTLKGKGRGQVFSSTESSTPITEQRCFLSKTKCAASTNGISCGR